MTPIADMVEQMMARGVDRDAILLAIRTAEACSQSADIRRQSADTTTEKRRLYDRERQRKKRAAAHESADNPPTSADSADAPLILKKDIDKKVSKSRRITCPPTWEPNENHFEAAAKLNIPRESVLTKAEDMRIWAGSSGALKADWDLTFHGFLRRDAPKLAVAATSKTTATITPKSPSWNAWKAHYRDTGQNFSAAHMDKCASDGKPFTVPSEWPARVA